MHWAHILYCKSESEIDARFTSNFWRKKNSIIVLVGDWFVDLFCTCLVVVCVIRDSDVWLCCKTHVERAFLKQIFHAAFLILRCGLSVFVWNLTWGKSLLHTMWLCVNVHVCCFGVCVCVFCLYGEGKANMRNCVQRIDAIIDKMIHWNKWTAIGSDRESFFMTTFRAFLNSSRLIVMEMHSWIFSLRNDANKIVSLLCFGNRKVR